MFKSDFNENVPFSKIMGKCFVMNVKDYFKMKPEGFEEKDIYNCESRYSTRLRSIKKIKVGLEVIFYWNWKANKFITIMSPMLSVSYRVLARITIIRATKLIHYHSVSSVQLLGRLDLDYFDGRSQRLPSCRWHFQMHFLSLKSSYCHSNFADISS